MKGLSWVQAEFKVTTRGSEVFSHPPSPPPPLLHPPMTNSRHPLTLRLEGEKEQGVNQSPVRPGAMKETKPEMSCDSRKPLLPPDPYLNSLSAHPPGSCWCLPLTEPNLKPEVTGAWETQGWGSDPQDTLRERQSLDLGRGRKRGSDTITKRWPDLYEIMIVQERMFRVLV